MLNKSRYVEVRFKLKPEEFEVYEKEALDNGMRSGTALITAQTKKQARIKMEQQLKEIEN
ncbi:hypothetical protein [Bacillus cereus]|uniref:hypothetical protein n=1 Tax=Bacillus cereus TaxID=1396 RepID=UPI000BFE5F83|nr:hypothetical protein [Bacillus cereus]PGP00474.1 hypothetical protein COA03_07040 [Bacillus cereus]